MSRVAALRPSIFDKLIADSGSNAGGRSLPCYVPSLDRFGARELRACLMRDLGWLLNDIHLASAIDLSGYPEILTSVINHGLPDLSGKSADAESMSVRAAEIATAIRVFEPRLEESSIAVQVDRGAAVDDNQVHFRISGAIRSAEEDERFIVSTAIDLDTGNVEVSS